IRWRWRRGIAGNHFQFQRLACNRLPVDPEMKRRNRKITDTSGFDGDLVRVDRLPIVDNADTLRCRGSDTKPIHWQAQRTLRLPALKLERESDLLTKHDGVPVERSGEAL